MKIARVTNIVSAIEELQSASVWVYAADMDGESIYSADLTGKAAFVRGGEGNGVRPVTAKACDKTVALPLRGKVNSLNASVACGVVVYEALRQRLK